MYVLRYVLVIETKGARNEIERIESTQEFGATTDEEAQGYAQRFLSRTMDCRICHMSREFRKLECVRQIPLKSPVAKAA